MSYDNCSKEDKEDVTAQKSRSGGFTLIEIMAVIAIMGIITAFLVVAAKGARKKADLDAARAGIELISSKIESYMNKRGDLPPNLNPGTDSFTTEEEIYHTLGEWGFTVEDSKRIDPWGNPYIIILSRDYDVVFPIWTPGASYGTPPYNKMANMYITGADIAKNIHEGDPATTPSYMDQTRGFQVISAGPDGLLSRDDREVNTDIDLDGLTVNGDNLTNW